MPEETNKSESAMPTEPQPRLNMKIKRLTEIVCLGFFIIAVFVFPSISYGETILYEQTDDSAVYVDDQTYHAIEFLGNGLSGHITEVCVKVTSPDSPFFKWSMGWNINPPYFWEPAGYIFADNFHSVPQDNSPHIVCRSVDTVLNPDYYYFFVVGTSRYGNRVGVYGSADSNSWRTSIEDSKRFVNNFWVDTLPVRDIWFQMSGTSSSTPEREPVVIVPGIMGSRLNRVSDGEEVWPNGNSMFRSLSDDYLDELKLNSSGQQISGSEVTPTAVIEKELNQILYKNLIDKFIQDGYIPDQSIFTAPYDWRLNINDELNRLNEKIQQAIVNSSNGKINIIAHSLGGLLVKEYLEQATSTEFLDKLILAGVPQLGAPKTFKVLNYGDNLGFETPILGIDILNPDRVKEISQNMPAVYELLPSRRYVQFNGGYVKDFGGGVKVLDYDQTKEFMLNDPADSRNSLLLGVADAFHQELDNKSINASNVYNIVGCQNPKTIGEFLIYDQGKFDINSVNGDGTVPLISAMNLSDGFINYFVNYSQTSIDHTGLIKDDRTLELINQIINNEPVALPTGISTSTVSCFETPEEPFTGETTIMFSTHSPVALHIYDSQNRHMGPMPNGDIELGIPKSSYEQIDENSFAFVPGGDAYRVVVDALDSGSFDLKTRIFAGSNLINSVVYDDIPIQNEQTNVELNFSNVQSDLSLKVDKEGDGVVDHLIQPDAVLSSSTAQDIIPPETQASTTGALGNNNWYSNNVSISLNAVDDNSGLLHTKYSLDSGETFNIYDGPIAIAQEGTTTLQYFSVDRAGNNEGIKSLEIKIDKTPPEIRAEFDLTKKDFVFGATDNLDYHSAITCATSECTVQDEAGNKSMLKFKKENYSLLQTLKLASISYNNSTLTFPDNVLTIKYKDKEENNTLKDFDQRLLIRKQQIIYIDYNKKKNESTIYRLLAGGKLSKEVIDGIKILQIMTEGGIIKTNIK